MGVFKGVVGKAHMGYAYVRPLEGETVAKKRSTTFAARLRELRTAAGLTQAQLAKLAGMHLRGLTKLEQGDREPTWASVLDLAEALGVDCTAFNQVPGELPRPARGRPPKGSADSNAAAAHAKRQAKGKTGGAKKRT